MKKHILFPTDFSDNAWSAAVYALKLYADEQCKFYFLHSLKMKASSMSNLSNKLLRVMKENALRDLQDLKGMAENSNKNANHEFELFLSNQSLPDAIDTVIEKYNIDLLVMGTKGATGAQEFFFGSNTIRIVKKIKQCPILIVPDEFDFVVPKQIAFPTDYNRLYGEELQPLKNLAALHDSKIRIVHINKEDQLSDVQNENKKMLKSYLQDYEYSFHWMPDYDTKTKEIQDFIEKLNIDILVMINYKHSLLENIVNEPIVKKIGFHPTLPFLVIPFEI